MGLRALIPTFLILTSSLYHCGAVPAQEAERSVPPRGTDAKPKGSNEVVGRAIDELVEQLRQHPDEPSTAAGRVGLFLMSAEGGETTLIASEPEAWLNECGSPEWSHDGKRIFFDASPGTSDYSLTRMKAIELADGHLAVTDLGAGNCPSPSATGDRVVFLVNPGAVPNAESGVWIMNQDGSARRRLGGYGRPRWSPDGNQFLIISFSNPRQVTLIDSRPAAKSGILQIPDQNIYSMPSWVGDRSIVAAIGEQSSDTIALLDITDPAECKVKEVLWKKGDGQNLEPYYPVYSPRTRRCIFAGRDEKAMALYSFSPGKSPAPKRLEMGDLDNRIVGLSCSPDDRYVIFSSDRPDRRMPTYPSAGRRPSVDAPALSSITIDGDLKDWPVAMERHAIRNLHNYRDTNGTGGLENALLSTSPDLSAAFSVGYDPKEHVIYVAVIVRDDQLIVGNTSSWDTDAVEVYVDGLHSDRVMPSPGEGAYETLDASDCPALEYIGLPGKGPVFGIRKSAGVERSGEDNPILQFGDIKQTKTRMAFRRDGDVTTYEWAVQAFDHYPDKPTKLSPGMKVGFDVVVIDRDTPAKNPLGRGDPEEDRSAWICWGPAVRLANSKALSPTSSGKSFSVVSLAPDDSPWVSDSG